MFVGSHEVRRKGACAAVPRDYPRTYEAFFRDYSRTGRRIFERISREKSRRENVGMTGFFTTGDFEGPDRE